MPDLPKRPHADTSPPPLSLNSAHLHLLSSAFSTTSPSPSTSNNGSCVGVGGYRNAAAVVSSPPFFFSPSVPSPGVGDPPVLSPAPTASPRTSVPLTSSSTHSYSPCLALEDEGVARDEDNDDEGHRRQGQGSQEGARVVNKLSLSVSDFTVTAATSTNVVPLAEGFVPGFVHEADNITVIKGTVSASALGVNPTTASSDIKKSGDISITLDLETKADVKVSCLKTKTIVIQVHCDGIKAADPAPPPPSAKKKKGVKLSIADAPAPASVDNTATPSPPLATTIARVC
ncbi:hypothetical protein GUJ93_ZPchr0009g2453 [Zizania palustris]|uniref:Late embryogenesis abundant protein LEA-2 subgroup domain-containing protein n=1 Tax=Zizania palustris TaxID=103762 RepID=A0A8J5S5A4_ZIZPA|nr:hypothetical protein GUJ93_ZPchr0009g2453 [Zizania palustris]